MVAIVADVPRSIPIPVIVVLAVDTGALVLRVQDAVSVIVHITRIALSITVKILLLGVGDIGTVVRVAGQHVVASGSNVWSSVIVTVILAKNAIAGLALITPCDLTKGPKGNCKKELSTSTQYISYSKADFHGSIRTCYIRLYC